MAKLEARQAGLFIILQSPFQRAMNQSDDICVRLADFTSPSKAELKARLQIATAALREIQRVAQVACKGLAERSDGGSHIVGPSAPPPHAASPVPPVRGSKRKLPQSLGRWHCPKNSQTCCAPKSLGSDSCASTQIGPSLQHHLS